MQARMPDEFYEIVKHFLPEQDPPGCRGGRPLKSHRVVLGVIWFVEISGCRWKDIPPEMGCCGETARCRLRDWEKAGVWDAVHQELLRHLRKLGLLDPSVVIIDSKQTRAVGERDKTGPSPVDRWKKGSKFTLVVDRIEVPLVIQTAPSNRSDHDKLIAAVESIPKIGGLPGRPKTHPDKLYADAGYDSDLHRDILRFMGIEPFIRRRRSQHGSQLGKTDGSSNVRLAGSKDFGERGHATIEQTQQSMPLRH